MATGDQEGFGGSLKVELRMRGLRDTMEKE
jgi:hypothetical protein